MNTDYLFERDEERNFFRKEMKSALAYIHEHFRDPNILVKNIAEYVSVSQDTLEHIFRKSKNITVVDYILHVRLNEVAAMLEGTDELVNSIAFSCGFLTMSYFNKVFKNYFHVTPTEYRKVFRKKEKLLRKKAK